MINNYKKVDILEVFIDLIMTSISDKYTCNDGRRIPFMKYSVIPYLALLPEMITNKRNE